MKAIVLGSGLSEFVSHFDIQSYELFQDFLEIEIYPLEGHERKLYLAKFKDQEFVILSGRLHYYEGYSIEEISKPLQYAIDKYKVSEFWVSSVSGAFRKEVMVGSWYKVKRLLSFPFYNQMLGSFGDDCSTTNDSLMNLEELSYAFQQGPSLGTLSEYKMLNKMGADLVGMSMWPEYLFCNSNDFNFSLLSFTVCNYFPLENIQEPSHKEVVALANEGAQKLANLFKDYLNITS